MGHDRGEVGDRGRRRQLVPGPGRAPFHARAPLDLPRRGRGTVPRSWAPASGPSVSHRHHRPGRVGARRRRRRLFQHVLPLATAAAPPRPGTDHGRRLGERPPRRRQRPRHRTAGGSRRGAVRRIEIDTSYFVGKAPGWARLRAVDSATDASRSSERSSWGSSSSSSS